MTHNEHKLIKKLNDIEKKLELIEETLGKKSVSPEHSLLPVYPIHESMQFQQHWIPAGEQPSPVAQKKNSLDTIIDIINNPTVHEMIQKMNSTVKSKKPQNKKK